jgi:hypothetical protein
MQSKWYSSLVGWRGRGTAKQKAHFVSVTCLVKRSDFSGQRRHAERACYKTANSAVHRRSIGTDQDIGRVRLAGRDDRGTHLAEPRFPIVDERILGVTAAVEGDAAQSGVWQGSRIRDASKSPFAIN